MKYLVLSFFFVKFSFGYAALYGENLIENSSDSVKGTRPNFVLFLADDMTWSDCGPYGNDDVITPNINQLAKEGMAFDNMFTSTAMCAPTRQQLMTGIFPARSGGYPNHSRVYDGVKSFAHYFKDMGYEVALIGKQHYGPDNSFPINYLGGRQHDSGKNGADIHLEKIKPIVESDKPFFLIIAQNQPHTPWNRGDADLYEDEKLSIPEYMVDSDFTRKELKKYYTEITYMDSLIGQTQNFIEDAGKESSTVSIFTTEQGYQFPFGKWTCYDLGLKTGFIIKWPGEIKENTRTKATTQYVDIVPTLLELADKNPDGIDVGVSDTKGYRGFDGKSFLPILIDGVESHRKFTYGIHTTNGIYDGSESYPIRSVRNSRYKYIVNYSSDTLFSNVVTARNNGIYSDWLENAEFKKKKSWVELYRERPKEELYDLKNDPYEKNNLAMKDGYAKIKKSLKNELEKWLVQQGDKPLKTEANAVSRQDK